MFRVIMAVPAGPPLLNLVQPRKELQDIRSIQIIILLTKNHKQNHVQNQIKKQEHLKILKLYYSPSLLANNNITKKDFDQISRAGYNGK